MKNKSTGDVHHHNRQYIVLLWNPNWKTLRPNNHKSFTISSRNKFVVKTKWTKFFTIPITFVYLTGEIEICTVFYLLNCNSLMKMKQNFVSDNFKCCTTYLVTLIWTIAIALTCYHVLFESLSAWYEFLSRTRATFIFVVSYNCNSKLDLWIIK